MTRSNIHSWLVLSSVLLLLWGCQTETESTTSTARELVIEDTVEFILKDGQSLPLEVALADDNDERAAGLMYIRSMDENQGMLFVFEDEQPRSFWMANTPLALDMLFVNESYEIVTIHRNTQPFSQRNFTSEIPAKYVIEVNGGYTIRHDIQEGMNVRIQASASE
jgi:uncharacterized membrane protein (UPF0127 family)